MTKNYKCVHCGRLLGNPVSHKCNGMIRKRKLKFKKLSKEEMEKENRKIWVRGDFNNPDGVIKALKRRGAKSNPRNLKGDQPANIYIIGEDDSIVAIEDWFVAELITSHQDWKQIAPEPIPQIKHWDDLVLNRVKCKGFVYALSDDYREVELNPITDNDGMVAADEKTIKSMIAAAKISHLLEKSYGGWVSYDNKAFAIVFYAECNEMGRVYGDYKVWKAKSNIIELSYGDMGGGLLRFHTREQAEEFLANNESLVLDYCMI